MKINLKKLLDNTIATSVVFIFIFFITLLPDISQSFDIVEKVINDIDVTDYYFSRIMSEQKIDTNIILVNIGNLERDSIGLELDIIMKEQPAVVGIDAYFRHKKDKKKDSILASILNKYNNIVLGSVFISSKHNIASTEEPDTLIHPLPEFINNNYFGFLNLEGDYNETKRIFKTYINYNDSIYYPFGTVIANIYDSNKIRTLLSRGNDFETIRYIGDHKKFTTFDIEQIFDSSVSKSKMKGKIVLMGYLGSSIVDTFSCYDKFFTPLNEKYFGRSLPDMHGLAIHANIIYMILNSRYIYTIPTWIIWSISFLILLINISIYETIKIKFPKLYGGEIKILVLFEIILIIILTILLFKNFYIKLNITLLFFALLIGPDISEMYFSSIKSLFDRLTNRRSKNEKS